MAFKQLMNAVVVAGMALVATVSGGSAEPYRIVGFGDSLMAGYGLAPGESYPEKLEAELKAKGYDVSVANAGVSGDTTGGGLSRLDWSVPEDADLVILELGANDMLRGVSPAVTRKNLDAMIARLKQRGFDVLLAGMLASPNLGPDYVETYNAIFPDLARKHGIPLYPFFLDGVTANRTMLLEDGMHPNASGIDRMVERTLPAVERFLRSDG